MIGPSQWSGGGGFEIEVKVPKTFLGGDVAAVVREEQRAATEEGMAQLADAILPVTPVHRGLLRKGVQTRLSDDASGVLGRVFNAVTYAQPVEYGSRPHFPPLAPLQRWAELKLGVPKKESRSVAFLIARKISKKGTPAARMFAKGLDAKRSAVVARFEQMNARIVARLRGRA